jgi:hypothetical protein
LRNHCPSAESPAASCATRFFVRRTVRLGAAQVRAPSLFAEQTAVSALIGARRIPFHGIFEATLGSRPKSIYRLDFRRL